MQLVRTIAAVLVLAAPPAAFAFGGHDSVGCTGCHARRGAPGADGFAVAPNPKYLNPRTNQPYSGVTAFCLTCHAGQAEGGLGHLPVSQHTSHPFGLDSVDAKVARVPPDLLRDGRFGCLACHDPHPSNPNYRYMRVSVGARGEKLDAFCALCHPAKGERRSGDAAAFDSMDERRSPARPPNAEPAPSPPGKQRAR